MTGSGLNGERRTQSEFLDHNKVRFERLTGVSADVIVLESRGSIGSDPLRGRLRTLGHVAEALLEVTPRVPGAFRGKTIKTAFQLKVIFFVTHRILHRCHLHSRS